MELFPLLTTRNARFLLGNRVLSQCGDGMLQTALATFILFSPQRATNPAQITAIFAALLIPYSFIGPFVGVFIDKWSRRSILIYSNLIRLCAIGLIAISVADHTSNFSLGVLVLVCLGLNRFLLATHAAALPHVVATHLLVNANAIFPTIGTIGSSIGAALGLGIQHLLGNVDRVNAGIIALSGAVSLCGALSATFITPRHALGPHDNSAPVHTELRTIGMDITTAARDIWKHREVVSAMGAVIVQRVTFGAVTVHTLFLVRLQWHSVLNPNAALNDFGTVAGCAAFGAGIAAIISGVLFRDQVSKDRPAHFRMRQLLILNCVSTSFGSIIIGLGSFNSSKLGMCASAFTLGLSGQFLKITADTTIQHDIPDVERGRTFALFDMVINVALVIGVALCALVPMIRDNAYVTAAHVSLLMLCALVFTVVRLRRLRNGIDLPTTL